MQLVSNPKPIVKESQPLAEQPLGDLDRNSSRPPMRFDLTPRGITRTLLWMALLLIAVNVFFLLIKYYSGSSNTYRIANVFDLNHERNIPTYFSSLLLLTSSVLLGAIAMESRMHADSKFFFWALLAAIFCFLSFDEVFMIHERFREPVKTSLNTSGLFNFAWVIPYGCVTIFFGIFFLRFILNLPKKVMFLFILSGVMYVSGAIGMEMIGGWWDEHSGQENAIYAMLYTIEESLELTGVIVFILGLLTYMTETIGGVRFRIVSDS